MSLRLPPSSFALHAAHAAAALALILLFVTPAQAAQPVDRWEKWLEAERYEDVADQARKWLEKRTEEDELTLAGRVVLAEAEYQLLQSAPSLEKARAYREEFVDGPREADAFELESKLALYAASEEQTEAAYRAIADDYSGTAAAAEALVRAEEAGFAEAVSAGSAEALASYLGRYLEGPNAATARRLWRARAWDEAEAVNTIQGWLDLRSNDPDHPRIDEALMREQALALMELPPGASTDALLKLARRYEGTPTGWETLRRALGRSAFRLSDATSEEVLSGTLEADLVGDADPVEGHLVEAISIDLVGPLPKSAEITFGVEVKIGREWFDWNVRAALHAGQWARAVEPAPERVGPAVHWLASVAPCALAEVTEARVRVHLAQEGEGYDWIRTLSLEQPCGGIVPLAVRYAPGGVVDAIGSVAEPAGEPTVEPTWVLAGGLAWNCSGAIQLDSSGLWLTCSGWQVSTWPSGLLFRPPPLGVASATGDPEHAELKSFPVEEGQAWLALDVPTSWHFGGRPRCPLPEVTPYSIAGSEGGPGGTTPGPVDIEPPTVPLWVHPGLERSTDLVADLDGDGLSDRLTVLAPRGDQPAWIVIVLGAFPKELSWTAPWDGPTPSGDVRVERTGCGYRVVPAEG